MAEARDIDESAIDEAIDLALDQLFNMGIAGRRGDIAGRHVLEIPSSGAQIPVEGLAASLATTPASRRDQVVSDFVWRAMQEGESFDASSLTDLDLSLGIRTFLLPADDESLTDMTYARPVAQGLVAVLVVEQRGKVAVLRDSDLNSLGRSADELFEEGQTRVNMETVQATPVWESVRVVEGDGMFTAARVLDMPALLDSLELDASRGALVVPLNQSVILVATPAPNDAIETLQGIAQVAWSIATSQQAPLAGGIITTNAYYWHEGRQLETAAFWRSADESVATEEGSGAGATGTAARAKSGVTAETADGPANLQLVLDPGPEFVAQMTRP